MSIYPTDEFDAPTAPGIPAAARTSIPVEPVVSGDSFKMNQPGQNIDLLLEYPDTKMKVMRAVTIRKSRNPFRILKPGKPFFNSADIGVVPDTAIIFI
jgi:hypothetical protein